MGNKTSCCVRGGDGSTGTLTTRSNDHRAKQYHHQDPRNYDASDYDRRAAAAGGGGFDFGGADGAGGAVINHSFISREDTSKSMLPHISDREIPDEEDDDPSVNPMTRPVFIERSKSEMRIKENRRSFYVLDANRISPPQPLRKSNSSSTIFLDDSTISQPNLKNTIRCISVAIYYHIVNRKNHSHERLMEIFEERLHPITREALSLDHQTRDPDHRQIYKFIRTLFHAAQLTAECAIITLVYIERLLTYAEMDLCPSNWRRVVLGAIMLASKVWDDQAVWNVDYCQILRDTNVDDMNELERQFLECLDFNINVPASVYAKYYYDLRTLAMANDLQLPLQPLYKERAKKLEALSRDYMAKVHDGRPLVPRRWSSADGLNGRLRKGQPVVLS